MALDYNHLTLTPIELLDASHLYDILAKRVKEPDWCGCVPKDKVREVREVLIKLYAAARQALHAYSADTAAWFPATEGALEKVPGDWWVHKGYDGRVWVIDDAGAACTCYNSDHPIIGTIREVRNGLVSLNVLPHMVQWVKGNLKAQPMPQPQQTLQTLQDALTSNRAEVLADAMVAMEARLKREFNERLDKMEAEVTPVLADITKTVQQLPRQHSAGPGHIRLAPAPGCKVIVDGDMEVMGKFRAPFHAAMEDLHAKLGAAEDRLSVVEAAVVDHTDRLGVQRGWLSEHGDCLASLEERLKPRRRALWRLLPWILTAAVGIGLGIANHYEGWIDIKVSNEAANR